MRVMEVGWGRCLEERHKTWVRKGGGLKRSASYEVDSGLKEELIRGCEIT